MSEESSKSGFLALLAAAVTAAYVGVASTSGPAPGKGGERPAAEAAPKEPGSAAKDVASVTDKDAFAPFAGFWALADVERGRDYVRSLPPEVLDPDRTDLEFLIATVPDPIDTRFGYRFDSILDDVQMAIEAREWNLDHFWLPWMPSGQQPGKRAALAPVTDPVKSERPAYRVEPDRKPGDDLLGLTVTEVPAPNPAGAPSQDPWRLQPKHRREPGVLLFRKPQDVQEKDGRQKLLALLVVGETPTSGIHKVPLSMSFDIIREAHLRRAAKPSRKKTVQPVFRIVGPQFSGSERSLSYTIASWHASRIPDATKEAWTFQIRTGGASAVDHKKFVTDCGPAPRKVTFDATIFHYKDVIAALLDYLKRLKDGKELGRIALLTESDTVYGTAAVKDEGKDFRARGFDVTEMKFPFHISQVAIAYDQSRRANDGTTPALVRPSNKLRIPFDETGAPRDVIPSLSPAMTSASDEFVMSRILDTISKEHYHYVGIIASDTRDIIFLAGLVRDYCPDVQLFLPAGDLMLGHPEYAAQLQGTILSSTYPLFSMAQRWDPPHSGDRRRHLFSHESDQGYYNATISLLAEGFKDQKSSFPLMYDYGNPFDEFEDISLFDRGRVGTALKEGAGRWEPPPRNGAAARDLYLQGGIDREERPALWFGVIGQKGVWPVGFQADPDKGHSTAGYLHAEKTKTPEIDVDAFARQFVPLVTQFTWQWGVCFLLLSAGVAFVVLCSVGATRGPGGSAALAAYMRPLDAGRFPWLRLQQEFEIVIGLALLLAAYWYCAAWPCSITLRDSAWRAFASRSALRFLPDNDYQNWWFCLFGLYLSQVAALGLAIALAVRLGHALADFLARPDFLARGPLGTGPRFARARESLRRGLGPLAGVGRRARGWSLALVPLLGVVLVGVESQWPYPDYRPPGADDTAAVRRDPAAASRDLAHPLLAFERAVNLSNGVSPLLPVLILTLAASAWFYCQLKRIALYHRLKTRVPVPRGEEEASVPFRPLRDRDHAINKVLSELVPIETFARPGLLIGALVAAIAILKLLMNFVPTVDGYRFNAVLIGAICFTMTFVVISLCRFLLLWANLRGMLAELAALPQLLPAFDRVPRRFSRLLGRYLDRALPRLSDLSIPVGAWELVARDRDAIEAYAREHFVATGRLTEGGLRRRLHAIAPGRGDGGRSGATALVIHDRFQAELRAGNRAAANFSESKTRRGLRRAAVASLELLALDWPTRDAPEAAAAASEAEGGRAAEGGWALDPGDGWKRRAEDLVAAEFVLYLSGCAAHLCNLATLLGLVPVLLLVAVSTYPFQPQRFLILELGGLLLTVIAAVVVVYVEMERDEVLSRVAGTPPDKVSLDRTFFTTIFAFLAPLIGLVLSMFPTLSDTLNQWLAPVFRSLK